MATIFGTHNDDTPSDRPRRDLQLQSRRQVRCRLREPRRARRTPLRVLCLVGALAASSAANANLLTNGSFEAGRFAPGSNQTMTLAPGDTSLTGWTITNDAIAWIGAGDPWGLDASDGDRFLDLTDYSSGVPFGGLSQSFATSPGTAYLVAFSLGSSTHWGRPSAVTVSAAGASQTFTSPASGGNNDWERHTMSFLATGPSTTLSIIGAAGGNYIGVDDVSVAAVAAGVPEPSTATLLLVGAGLLLARARRAKGSTTAA